MLKIYTKDYCKNYTFKNKTNVKNQKNKVKVVVFLQHPYDEKY